MTHVQYDCMFESLGAKKSLGQHFLKSKSAVRAMIDAPQIGEHDIVVEIGPGKGVLTRALLDGGARVVAFELDHRMIEFLHQEFSSDIKAGKLILVHQDILEVDIDGYVKGEPYKIVANIPYYITNLIIRKFLETEHQPTDMSLLIQKEVAERIVAKDGKQSLLSLSVAVYGTARYVAKVEKKYFSPAPRVDSAIIHIYNISHTLFASFQEERDFFELLHLGFAHRRKQLQANLKKTYESKQIIDGLTAISLPIDVRGEDISLEKWVQLFNFLKQK